MAAEEKRVGGDLKEVATALTAEVRLLREEVTEQHAYGRRNRRLIRVTIASVILDILLTGGVIANSVRIGQATAQTRRTQVTQKAQCERDNRVAAKNHDLWYGVLNLLDAPGSTPGLRAFVTSSRAKVDQAFAVRDCRSVGR